MCDVAHALWVERITREVLSAQQVAAVALMGGAKADWPDLNDKLADFETALVAEPRRIDPDELALRRALGLRDAG